MNDYLNKLGDQMKDAEHRRRLMNDEKYKKYLTTICLGYHPVKCYNCAVCHGVYPLKRLNKRRKIRNS